MLSDLYALRLDMFRLFLWSVATAVVLSLFVSATITVPVQRLRNQARVVLDAHGRLTGGFTPSKARDEVGEALPRPRGAHRPARASRPSPRVLRFRRVARASQSPRLHFARRPSLALASASGETEERAGSPHDGAGGRGAHGGGSWPWVREISRNRQRRRGRHAEGPADAREMAGRVLPPRGCARVLPRSPTRWRASLRAPRSPRAASSRSLENLLDNATGFSPAGRDGARGNTPRRRIRRHTRVRRRSGRARGTPGEDFRLGSSPGGRARRKACTRAWGWPSSRPLPRPIGARCASPTFRGAARASRCACRRRLLPR